MAELPKRITGPVEFRCANPRCCVHVMGKGYLFKGMMFCRDCANGIAREPVLPEPPNPNSLIRKDGMGYLTPKKFKGGKRALPDAAEVKEVPTMDVRDLIHAN